MTLLHPPYTAWHLSYFAHRRGDRAAAARRPSAVGPGGVRAGGGGRGARARRAARPAAAHDASATARSSAGGLAALLGAVAIGVAGVLTVSVWLAPLVLAGGLFLPAYNLELAGGRFHSDLWFAIGWGAFPAFTGYFVNAEKVALPGLLIAAGCMAMSVAQRRLSSPARELRRRTLRGERHAHAARRQQRAAVAAARCCAPLDGALAAMSLAMVADRVRARRRAPVTRRSPLERLPSAGTGPAPLQQVRAGAGAHLAGVARRGTPGANRPSTLPPKPPPTSARRWRRRSRSRSTAASTAGVETS